MSSILKLIYFNLLIASSTTTLEACNTAFLCTRCIKHAASCALFTILLLLLLVPVLLLPLLLLGGHTRNSDVCDCRLTRWRLSSSIDVGKELMQFSRSLCNESKTSIGVRGAGACSKLFRITVEILNARDCVMGRMRCLMSCTLCWLLSLPLSLLLLSKPRMRWKDAFKRESVLSFSCCACIACSDERLEDDEDGGRLPLLLSHWIRSKGLQSRVKPYCTKSLLLL